MPHNKTVANLIKCPECGNEHDFIEVIENEIITNHYIQNSDGSFSLEEQSSQSVGTSKLFCGVCEEDLSGFFDRFAEMIF